MYSIVFLLGSGKFQVKQYDIFYKGLTKQETVDLIKETGKQVSIQDHFVIIKSAGSEVVGVWTPEEFLNQHTD